MEHLSISDKLKNIFSCALINLIFQAILLALYFNRACLRSIAYAMLSTSEAMKAGFTCTVARNLIMVVISLHFNFSE